MSAAASDTKPKRSRLRVALSACLIVAVGATVVLTLWRLDRGTLLLLVTSRALPYLALTTGTVLLATVFGMLAWRVLLAGGQPSLRRRASWRIFAAALLTKYLPGRLWALVTHVQMGRAAGMTGARMTSAFLLSMAIMVFAGAAVAMTAPNQIAGHTWWLVVPVVALVIVAGRPSLVGRAYAVAARQLRRRQLTEFPSARHVRWSIAYSTAYWVCCGLHLWVIAGLLGAQPAAALPVCVGGFALASLVGGFAFFLPDGWGAREVTMAAVLSTVLPWTAAGTAAVASRVVCVVAEVAFSLAVLLATARSPFSQPGEESQCATATT
jgi:hypothetical protein